LRLNRFYEIFCFLVVLSMITASIVWSGEIDDSQSLGLFASEEPCVPISRIPRPISRIAENVTVITAEQIAELNAHTLSEVLNTVPGIQLEVQRTPGSSAVLYLQGAPENHIQILVDGIIQNNLLQGLAETGLIPVQRIERIEIIKGAAAAAWGQALGGVINVVTKAPNSDKKLSGTVFSSIGAHHTSDLQVEQSGTIKRFGYYISGGNLHSNGLLPNNGVNQNNAYGKFTYELPSEGNLTAGFNFIDASRGLDETVTYHDNTDARNSYGFLTLTQPVSQSMTLEFNVQANRRDSEVRYGHFDQGAVIVDNKYTLNESTLGGSAKLLWGNSLANLVAGVEYEHGKTRQWDALDTSSPFLINRAGDRISSYLSGAYSFGSLTILPGIRFDHTIFNDEAFSYTVGATYTLSEKTALRAYFARGYSLANALWSNGPQRVWTVQTGAETSEIPYLWLKGTLFYNDTWNVEVPNSLTPGVTLRSQIKQGVELETRTTPLYNVFLAAGYTFTDARDEETGTRLNDVPEHGIKLSLHYDDQILGLRGIVTGNYVRWNAQADDLAKYDEFIWDLSLTKKLFPNNDLSPEIFFSVHNILDGSQYVSGQYYKNTGRWLEGGARFRF
jgi:vitamin B12 transporter